MRVGWLREVLEQDIRMLARLGVVVLGLWASVGAAAGGELIISGEPTQGGLVHGRVSQGAQVWYEGRKLRVSKRGEFVIGFGRNEPSVTKLNIRYPGGNREQRQLNVAQREYDIQRIDGLPPRKVEPAAEDLVRIRQEAALIKAARRRDSAHTDFLGGFTWPVVGQISGVYGSQRVLNGKPRRPHYGIDVAARAGTPVQASASGVVSLVHRDMYFTGGTIIIDHGHGLSSVFSHLSEVHVQERQRVARGETIAKVGATGRATGPHLHWGINWFERRLDPQLMAGPMPTVAKQKSR
jgi:murein DD-endopeptidase MepM/ murein hydrolase activator NlpD